jgi:hypothetical protein
MGKLASDAALLTEYQEYVSMRVRADVEARLAKVASQVAKIVQTGMEEENYVDHFIERKKKDRSPVRKEEKKSKKSKSEKKESEKADAPKPAKKRKDMNAPKGPRNAHTMFKIDRAADLAGYSRDDRFAREKELYASLTDAQKEVYTNMALEDRKRWATETALYKEGKYVPGQIPLPESKKEPEAKARKEPEPKEEEKVAAEKPAKKNKTVHFAGEKEKEKEPEKEKDKKKAKKAESSDSDSWARSDSDSD